MLKPIIAATAVLGIAGSSVVYAQQQFGGHHGHWGQQGQQGQHHHRLSPADFSAMTDARIAALKAGLELTPDQQQNWGPFEQALRQVAQLRLQRMQARQGGQPTGGTPSATPQQGAAPAQNPFDRLAHRADAMTKTSAALKRLADAGTPLYQSLTDAQKARFKMLSHFLRPHHQRRMAFNEGGGGGRGGGHGGHHRFGPAGGGGGRDGDGGGSGSQL
jgi:zinc resistance-associated protein